MIIIIIYKTPHLWIYILLLLLLLLELSIHRCNNVAVDAFTLVVSRSSRSLLLTSSSSSSSSLVPGVLPVVVRNQLLLFRIRTTVMFQQQQQQQNNNNNDNVDEHNNNNNNNKDDEDNNNVNLPFYYNQSIKSTLLLPNPYKPRIDNDSILLYQQQYRIDSSLIQTYHPQVTPVQRLQQLVTYCQILEEVNNNKKNNNNVMESIDVYSDWDKSIDTSYVRAFEAELASDFNMEDSIIMPSGTMAQQIALLVHTSTTTQQQKYYENNYNNNNNRRPTFACHYTSHLLLHEYNTYKELANFNVHIIHTHPPETTTTGTSDSCSSSSISSSSSSNDKDRTDDNNDNNNNYHIVPLLYHHIKKAIQDNPTIQVIIIELPHREIGGKVTPYNDLIKIRDLCRSRDIRLHCDGARIFEATTAYDDGISLQKLVAIFDSIYISFYKGLGGLAGCALLGKKPFCDSARIWQKRYGGIMYSTLPYTIAAKYGYETYWKQFTKTYNNNTTNNNVDESYPPKTTTVSSSLSSTSVLSFMEKKIRLQTLVQKLTSDPIISQIISFDPTRPETNMIHGYLPFSVEDINQAIEHVYKTTQIKLLHRIRPVPETHPAYINCQYLSMFEWIMGPANAAISDLTYLYLWYEFAITLLKITTCTNVRTNPATMHN